TAHIGGKKYYAVSRNRTNAEMRRVAESLGYERISGARFLSWLPRRWHAEHILLNALDRGRISGTGRIAPSRPACSPGRAGYQGCAVRISRYPGIRLIQ